MSRIGKKPITVPSGVTLTQSGQSISVKGPKGELSFDLPDAVSGSFADNELTLAPVEGAKNGNAASWMWLPSAFAPALTYFTKGVELLPSVSNRWELEYQLCLDLYSSAAEVEFCIGTFTHGEQLAQDVQSARGRVVKSIANHILQGFYQCSGVV